MTATLPDKSTKHQIRCWHFWRPKGFRFNDVDCCWKCFSKAMCRINVKVLEYTQPDIEHW